MIAARVPWYDASLTRHAMAIYTACFAAIIDTGPPIRYSRPDQTSMQQTHQKSFEVAVVGGGVCGLTCAIALQKAGVPVQLFEAAVRSTHTLMLCFLDLTRDHRQHLARLVPGSA